MRKIKTIVMVLILCISIVGCSSEDKKEVNEDEMEVTIYLVRHGKTWFNTTNQVQGFCDSPLTEVGEEQAEMVGEGLKDISFIGAYSSDLGRQRSTANLILSKNSNKVPNITEIIGFREKNFDSFEGRSNDEMNIDIAKSLGVDYPEDGEELWAFLKETLGEEGLVDKTAEVDPMQEAENWEEVVTRGKGAIEEVVNDAIKKGGGNVLVVSSGGIIPVILESVIPGQYNGEKIGNCSVTIITYKNGEYTLEVLADDSYINK
ncbi:MAG: histidine phosphatase family protein [Coprobacillaceae bacterium]